MEGVDMLRKRLRYYLLLLVVCVPVSQALADEDWIDSSQGTISNGVFTAKNTAIGATLTITNAAYSYKDGSLNHLKTKNQDATTTITFTFTNKNYSINKFWCNAYYKKKKKVLWTTTTVSERVYPAGKDGNSFSRTETDNTVSYSCTGKFDNVFLNAVYLNYNVDEEVAANAPTGVRKQYNGYDQVLFEGSTDKNAYTYSTYTNSKLNLKCGGSIYFWFEGTGLTSDKGLAKDKGTYTMKWKYNVLNYNGKSYNSFVYSKGGGIMYLTSNKFDQFQSSTFTSEIYGLELTDVTAPTAKSLKYTGEPQVLVTAASSSNAKAMYNVVRSDKTDPTDTNDFSETIPTRTEAGTYIVSWYMKATNSAYNDYYPGTNNTAGQVIVQIQKVPVPTYTEPKGLTHTFDGQLHPLTTGGSATGGTLYYSVDGDDWDEKNEQLRAKDYTVRWYIKGDNNHLDTGSEDSPVGTVQAKILKADYNMKSVTWSGNNSVTYDGQDHKDNLIIDINTLPNSNDISVSYTYQDANNQSVEEIVNAGTYTVTAHYETTSTDYHDPADMSATLTVLPFNLASAYVAEIIPAQGYTGAAVTPVGESVPVLKHSSSDGALTIPYTAYQASYLNNVSVGENTATAILTSVHANYTGSINLKFSITKASLRVKTTEQTITYGSAISSKKEKASLVDANGDPVADVSLSAVTLSVEGTPSVGTHEQAIRASEAHIVDTNGNDITVNYSIEYPEALRGTLTVTAKEYTDATKGDFTVSGLKPEYEGNGTTAVTPDDDIALFDGTTRLVRKTTETGDNYDYDVTYSDNTQAGTATATFTFKNDGEGNYTGNYSGTFTKTFEIFYTAPTWSRKTTANYNYGTYYNASEKLCVKDADAQVFSCALSNDKKSVVLTEVTDKVIQVGTPVMLRTASTASSVKLYATTADATYTGKGNALVGVTAEQAETAISSDSKTYIFDGDSFVWATGGNYVAHRAYINGGTGAGGHLLSAPRLSLVFDASGTTAIDLNVNDNLNEKDVWYDLQGRRLDGRPTGKGLYILNGKKVLVP